MNVAPPLPSSDRREAPAVVSWRVVKGPFLRDGETFVVLLGVIERRVAMKASLSVSVEIPPGVRLVRGEPAFDLPPNAAPDVTQREVDVAYAKEPPEDIVLVADLQSAHAGVHATDRYRFSRPAPQVSASKPDGPRLVIGGRDYGPSVVMGTPAAPVVRPPPDARR